MIRICKNFFAFCFLSETTIKHRIHGAAFFFHPVRHRERWISIFTTAINAKFANDKNRRWK